MKKLLPFDKFLDARALYISRAVSNLYGTEIEIWAGIGLVGNTEKKEIWSDYEQLLRTFFHVFGCKNFLKCFLKSCII